MIRFDLTGKDLKAKFYLENKYNVHIETSNNKFYNGFITKVYDESIVLNDRVLGEILIPFIEIESIDKFIDKEENK